MISKYDMFRDHDLDQYVFRDHDLYQYVFRDHDHNTCSETLSACVEDWHIIIIIIIVTSFAPISSKIKLSGATKPGD